MKYDFDRVIERKGSGSVKWEYIVEGKDLVRLDNTSEEIEVERVNRTVSH